MKIYLVGGAVRDELLGLPVKEKDWVVVGSTPEEMRKNKFKQVGKDFPVFIHPKTGEEYALARTERKSGHGYTGFEFDANPNVTLEEDLARRDLTINAIAQDEDGTLIDPYNGQGDIKNKKLRHVSDSFSEDPLRVLRVARFYALLGDFIVVPETVDKIKEIVESGELEHLTPERKWLEIYKTGRCLRSFFGFLYDNKAGDILFPEIKPETRLIDYGGTSEVGVIAFHLYTFISTSEEIESFCQRLKVPNEYKELTLLLHNCLSDYCNYSPSFAKEEDGRLLSLVKRLDIRKQERLKLFMEIVYCSVHIKKFEGHQIFFEELIHKISSFKLSEEDQKKPGIEIKKIIENAHKEIAQDSIINLLNKSD